MSARMFGPGIVIGALCLFLPVVPAAAQNGRASVGQAPTGAEMYRAYCAPCHGAKGLGDGPVASSLKVKPTDLTRLTVTNKGVYPVERVGMVLQFGVVVPAHGTTDMPTWGSTFRAMGDERSAQERVTALSKYMETLQVKK